MRLNNLLEKLPFVQRVNSVLVCEADYSGLRAAVLNRHGDDVTIAFEAHSELQDFHAAVAEVVTHVRELGWQGKHAMLLTPAVMLAMLDLPIPQKNKLAPAQLAESISWELEPLIPQHLGTLTLARVLIALGYLTTEQAEDVVSQQSIVNNTHNLSPSETFTYKRFGEVALELGYITPLQLQKCLDTQRWFQAEGDDIKCGWSAQGAKAADEDDLNNEAQYQWLTAAVNQSLLRQWQAAFFAQGIKLEYLYPLSGCAASTLNLAHKGAKHQLLLEAYDTHIAGLHLAGNKVQSLHVQANTLHQTLNHLTETYHLLQSVEFETIWFADAVTKNEVEASKLVTSLEHIAPSHWVALSRPSHLVSLGMMGAARHMMNLSGAHRIAGVPVSNPQPALLQRPEVRAFLAGLGLLLVLGTAELVLQVRQSLIAHEDALVSQDLKVVNDAIARVQAKVDEVKGLKDTISNLQQDKKSAESALTLLTVDLPKRNQTIISLLNELKRTVSEDVVIDRIAEDPLTGFAINAWALNENAAQEFVKTFQVSVQPLGFKLKNIIVTQQTGRLGLIGYAVNFSLTTQDDTVLGTAKPAAALR